MTNFNFSDIIEWDALSEAERTDILRRPAVMAGDKITAVVSGILDEVESRGDAALRDFSAKFDRTEVKNFKVSKAEVDAAISRLSPEFIKALQTAAKNIEKFHSAEVLETVTVETMPGVVCQQVTRPIGAVGLYIPGGTAPLFSTVLMLGIPAKIAGCSRVILCSPPPIADPILAAARLCGIDEIYQVGGAQAIAAMAFGTETIPSVSKIFETEGIVSVPKRSPPSRRSSDRATPTSPKPSARSAAVRTVRPLICPQVPRRFSLLQMLKPIRALLLLICSLRPNTGRTVRSCCSRPPRPLPRRLLKPPLRNSKRFRAAPLQKSPFLPAV